MMHKIQSHVTQAELHDLFEYRDDGHLIRRSTGRIAGCLDVSNGYTILHIKKQKYRVHRLIFLFHHGHLPEMIDHIDGNRSNNKIENLREATKNQNCHNYKKPVTNTSGYKNIYWDKNHEKWRVMIEENGKQYTKRFKDKQEAIEYAEQLRNQLHKDFARRE